MLIIKDLTHWVTNWVTRYILSLVTNRAQSVTVFVNYMGIRIFTRSHAVTLFVTCGVVTKSPSLEGALYHHKLNFI
jgi:hypothetical protein